MSEQKNAESVTGDDAAGCQFPAGPDGQVCGEAIGRSGAPGRPSRYCENPEHTRAKAFAARRSIERAVAGGFAAEQAMQRDVVVPERPVTDGRSSFGALLSRFEEAVQHARQGAAEQQAQLAAILERATEVVRTVSDPDAAGYEVEQIQREASVKVAEAQTAQAAAERDARDARKNLEREAELRAQADEAAEEALQELDTVRTETIEELDRVRAETAEAITAAQDAAEAHRRETIVERDRVLAEREADMRRQIEQAKTEAAEQIADARAEAQEQAQAAQRTVEEVKAETER
ncbi:MAG: hypothetical protein ACRDQ6_23805, partial [Pseudonocardiaceae bacterium]